MSLQRLTENHKAMIQQMWDDTPQEMKDSYFNKSGIYGIYCDGELVYIGKSINLLQRWLMHKSHVYCPESPEYNRPIYKEIRRALKAGHKISAGVIEFCDCPDIELQLEQEESKLIKKYVPKLNRRIPTAGGGYVTKGLGRLC